MARTVVVEGARVVALAHHRICHRVCHLGCPRQGVAGENGRKSRAPRAALLLRLLLSMPPTAAATDGLPLPATVIVPRWSRCSPFRIEAVAAAAAAIGANIGSAAACCQRYFSSVISAAPTGVAIKRGEDPVVNRSHSREEGGGIKDDDNDAIANTCSGGVV